MTSILSSSPPSTFDVSELNWIREKIESMPKFNQVEILRILNQNGSNVVLNENKYGVHVNLTDLSDEIITDLKVYLNYVSTQELNLNELEKQKEEFKNIYFAKDVKDTSTKLHKNGKD